jgi:hypothetical protein
MPPPSPVLATVLLSAPTPTSGTPRKLKRHFGTDITASTNNSPAIHHSCDFATMIKRVKEYDEQLYGDKQVWLDRRDMQYETIARYRAKLKQRAELDEKERPSLKRRRLDGGGRKALLPEEDELAILEWVKERRGGNRDHFAHVVTVQQLIAYASLLSGKTLTEGWVWGFMERRGLSLRTITTGKVSDTPFISGIVEEFRYEHRHLLGDKSKSSYTFNMDETAIFYDDPGKRTIDIKGTSTVAAHGTKKGTDRVTVVIYVSADGTVGPPLMVFPASRLTPVSRLKTEKGRQARKAQMALWNKPERFTVRIPVFNVLDEDEVVLDGEFEEDAAPSSDIAAARRQQRNVETTRLKRLRERMAELARFTVYKEVVAYRAKNETGWMVSPLMVAWLTDVFVSNTIPGADGLRHLYMDNMGAHETPSVQIQMMESGIRFHPLPPNCSHLLQPLDHSLNATVKYVYRLLHARWLLRSIEQGVMAKATRRDPASEQDLVTTASKVKRKNQPKRKLVVDEEVEREEKVRREEDEEEEKEGEEEGAEGVKGENRTRGPRKEEVEERIVASVYALSRMNALHSWEHTLNGTRVVAAAVDGHNQREKDGCQVTIPATSKKRKKSDDPLAQEQLEAMIRAQMEEEEQMMSSLGDDLHVVVSGLSDHCSATPPYANTKQPPSVSKPCALFHRLLYSTVHVLYGELIVPHGTISR